MWMMRLKRLKRLMQPRNLVLAAGASGLLGGLDPAMAWPIDMLRTAAGATLFSDRVADTQTAWSILLQPGLTPPASGTPTGLRLAEVGMGNRIRTDLGQVQQYASIDDRMRRLIWDLLALQPTPQVFYVDPYRNTGVAAPSDDWPAQARQFPAADSRVRTSGGGNDRPKASSTSTSVPEPSSLLMALGGMPVASRRKRRRGGGR